MSAISQRKKRQKKRDFLYIIFNIMFFMKYFEHKTSPLLGTNLFIFRQIRFLLYALGFLFFSLGIGIVGYRFFCNLDWIDALLNASMILTGMGPVTFPQTISGKIFASMYAIYSGVAFLTSVGLLFSPIIHRILHKMNIDEFPE